MLLSRCSLKLLFATMVLLACWFVSSAWGQSVPLNPIADSEEIIFTPADFDKVGDPAIATGETTGSLKIVVRDGRTGEPSYCRVNVVGSDGNFYEPTPNYLSQYSLTGVWPNWPKGWGNRPGKGPFRYFGRFFYSSGESTVTVPAGPVRVEVWKGFEFRPESISTHVETGGTRTVELSLNQSVSMTRHGYHSGDAHIHIARESERDDHTILDLLESEDVRFGAILGYNEPPGPYSGFMEKMRRPQMRGVGTSSIVVRGDYHILSGQEYRTSTYGHLSLYLRDEIVFPGEDFNADNWPLYGHVGRETLQQGGYAFYAHGGYAQAIYADFVQGAVSGVELLQFAEYRGIGLADWYHILNIGYRFPCIGASDYPPCRKLADCRTYAHLTGEATFPEWLQACAEGRSFVTTGPLLLLEVDGRRPGAQIAIEGSGPHRLTVRLKVLCEVAPVTHVQLIAGGEVFQELVVSASQGRGNWIELEQPLDVDRSTWIAARAYSKSPGGAPDAESHTNPVYVYIDWRAPYDRQSLDALVGEIDKQIARHTQRDFQEKGHVLAYFQRSRDMLMEIRAAGGVKMDFDPQLLVQALEDDEPGEDVFEMTDEQLKAYLKPVPPLPPHQAETSFETVGNLRMQLVAAEPLVYDPIAAAFDENGNLYVCEMRDYPYKPEKGEMPIGTVRLLRDTDGDGRFDESTIFADQLLWAGGVVPWKGGVFVAAPPDIWYMKDTDGDFVADQRQKVYTGFGTGNQQGMLNNLVFGLDHKIYGSTSVNGGTITSIAQPDKPVSVNRRDFRFDPIDGKFESITGTVQFGNAFDDWGNRFLCSESQPLQMPVLPQHYLQRNPYLPVPSAIHNITPGPVPIFRISPVERWRHVRSLRRIASNARAASSAGASHHVIDAAAGVTIYRGGACSSEFYGNVFIADGQNNLIHRRRLVPSGVTFSSERIDQQTEVVRSPDLWFRPVNFVNAPDGTLYVLDMSREFLETIHIPLDVVKHLDLKSGRDFGRIYRLAPPDFALPDPPRLGEASTEQLVEALASPHGWWRETAHRLIYERQDATAAEPLRHLLADAEPSQTRVHALWSLQGLKALTDSGLIAALGDASPRVREHAVRLSEQRLDQVPDLLNRVLALADDGDARVRFQVAFSLGESADPRVASALAAMLRTHAADRWTRTAILSSIAEFPDELLIALVQDEEQDEEFVLSNTGGDLLEQLSLVVGIRNQEAGVQRVLDAAATQEPLASNRQLQRRIVMAIGRGLKQSGGHLPTEGARTPRAKELLHSIVAAARQTAATVAASESDRTTAIGTLSFAPLDDTRATLSSLLDIQQPQSAQIAAVKALSGYAHPDITAILLEHWQQSAPSVRVELIQALLAREERTLALLKAAEQGEASVAQIELPRRDLLLNHTNEAIRKLANKLFDGQTTASRQAVVDDYQAALKLAGDAVQGHKIFLRDCSVCHQLGNEGHAIGPNLAASPARDPAAILVHVLDPSRYVLPNYVSYLVEDVQGRTYTGMIAAETATSITLKREKNAQDTILRANIAELVSTGKSLMPEGVEKTITKQEMADLLAFLHTAHEQNEDVPGVAPVKTATDVRKERDFGTLPGLVEPED